MDLHYKQEVTVGALVLIAVALFVGGTMWLTGRSFSPTGNVVRVEFPDVETLKRGNPVRISGVEKGSVQAIRFREVGRVEVMLLLDDDIEPRLDASAILESIGLVGDMMVDFDPGQSSERLPSDRIIQGRSARGLMALGADLGEQAQTTLSNLSELADKRLADDLHATLASIQRLASVFADRREGPTAELTAALSSMQDVSARLDSVLASPALDRVVTSMDSTSARLGRLGEQFTVTGARLDSLLLAINRGDGTLGRLATDTALYAEIRDLTAAFKALVDTLAKHPGKITVQFRIF